MKTKILNFVEVMLVGEILHKYEIDSNIPILDYVELLLSKITPQDYSKLLQTFSNKSELELLKTSGVNTLKILSSGVVENNIPELLKYYSSSIRKDG